MPREGVHIDSWENEHIRHTTSDEWKGRKTQDVMFLADPSTKMTVFRNDFPGYLGWPHFWDKAHKNKWEATTFKIIQHFLRGHAEAAYIDFGAWVGPTALFAAIFSNHVYALEPDHNAFSGLVANVNANSHLEKHIELYNECINTETGPMTFRGIGDSTSRFRDDRGVSTWGNRETRHEWTISCRTLPEFIQQEGIRHLRLIKIDTEGAELVLLPSLVSWFQSLRHPKPAIWLSVHQPFYDKDVPTSSKEALWTAIGEYKFVYLEGTTLVDIQKNNSDMLCKDFCSYILTDDEFVMPL